MTTDDRAHRLGLGPGHRPRRRRRPRRLVPRAPALGAPDAEPPPASLVAAARPRRPARRPHRGRAHRDRPGRRPRRRRRTPTCACTCSRPGCALRGRSTSTASSASCRTWCGRRPARAPSRASSRSGCRAACHAAVTVTVFGVDKFPRMVDYVVPSGVRIADADRVRLGAHLAEGTTVMHEGFVNFNAGTLGASRWSRAASRRASSSATAPTWAAARRSWARCPAAARSRSRSASAACWAPTPASASRSATTASSRPAST